MDEESALNWRGESELERLTGTAPSKKVSIPLAEMTQLLVDAKESNRAWLDDFASDQVRIDADLYDVLLHYQEFRRAAA